ncbi:MAG: hypothetical protein PVI11_04270 [Candidatus Aminicenantes bacterium]|jgi:hypothetical protein
MKKAAILILILFVFVVFLPSLLLADSNDDIQTVKKVVKKNPDYTPGQEVQWFKVLITDNDTGKTKIKVTLPISVVEAFLKCSHEEHFDIGDDCDIDLKKLFADLKKHGPMVFIEIYDEDEDVTIKVWVE